MYYESLNDPAWGGSAKFENACDRDCYNDSCTDILKEQSNGTRVVWVARLRSTNAEKHLFVSQPQYTNCLLQEEAGRNIMARTG